MSPSDLLIAVMLLSAPPGTLEQTPPPDRWPDVQAAIHQVAMDWEIMDERERRYFIAKPDEFQDDLDFLRQRRINLEDAPKLSESDRLPPRGDLMNCGIRFNRDYRQYLGKRLLWEKDRASDITKVIEETDRLYRVWDAIRDAKAEYHYVTVRRLALKKLRTLLGEDAYNRCELPPYVPEWRFVEVR